MHIRQLRLRNFQCYAGEVVLDLEPKAYSVVARHATEADRSNWLGKSSLLEAIVFALYGSHRHPLEDGWITRGEKAGEVTLVTDTGLSITRSRTVGKATRLALSGGGAAQAEAQTLVDEAVGLGAADFAASCYFAQKQMAQLITLKAADRMSLVANWLQLGPLEQCEDLVRARLAGLLDTVAAREKALFAAEQVLKSSLGDVPSLDAWEVHRAELAEAAATAEARRTAAKGALAAVEQDAAEVARLEAQSDRFDALLAHGQALQAGQAAGDYGALTAKVRAGQAELQGLVTARVACDQAVAQARSLASGTFDGRCPVAQMSCPVREDINAQRGRNAQLLAEARVQYDAAAAAERVRQAEHAVAVAELEVATRRDAQLSQLRDQLEALVPARKAYRARLKAGPLPDAQGARAEFEAAATAEVTARGALAQWMRVGDQARAAFRQQMDLDAELTALRQQLATVREALVVFGKNGAQRRIAESALGEIESAANDMLREAGVALSVGVQWSREGQGLAGACDACGAPFPASARVKVCGRCQGPRGPKLVHKLDITLSDRSGAAEDLAGGALQLAASAWLRTGRNAGWNVALIDEPFSALDAANRRAFASHLGTLLRAGAFQQAMVISHTPDTVDALPGRIEVQSDGRRATALVVA